MEAIDTNLVVRFLVGDDAAQAEAATACIAAGVFIPYSVLMETEWVIRRRYGWDRKRINAAFRQLLQLDEIRVPQGAALMWALDRHQQGADWADMLHLIASNGHTAFVTFDTNLAKKAIPGAPIAVRTLR